MLSRPCGIGPISDTSCMALPNPLSPVCPVQDRHCGLLAPFADYERETSLRHANRRLRFARPWPTYRDLSWLRPFLLPDVNGHSKRIGYSTLRRYSRSNQTPTLKSQVPIPRACLTDLRKQEGLK